MIVIQNVTMYQCEHCKKKQQRAHTMKRHEQFCSKNPNNYHPCISCKHLLVDKFHVGADPNEGYGPTCKTFYCNKLDIDMYSYRAEQMRLMEKYPEDYEEKHRMPNSCKWHEPAFEYDEYHNAG